MYKIKIKAYRREQNKRPRDEKNIKVKGGGKKRRLGERGGGRESGNDISFLI